MHTVRGGSARLLDTRTTTKTLIFRCLGAQKAKISALRGPGPGLSTRTPVQYKTLTRTVYNGSPNAMPR